MMSDKLAADVIEVITGLRRRLDTTLERVREMACPAPMKLHPDDRTTGGCFDRGQCGCVHGGIMEALLDAPRPPRQGED